jgi:N-acetylglucosamine-6-phosphate deacetylase
VIVLSGAALVLPDRILSPGTLVIEEGRIAEIRPDAASGGHADSHFAFHGHYIVPGFIDVHVHGVDGVDALDLRPERRHRVLSHHRRVRAGGAAPRSRPGAARTGSAGERRVARAARAPRK